MEDKSIETKLYVGNLAAATTEQALRQLFAEAGHVTAVEIITDQASGQSRGYAFVTMGTPAEARTAVDMFHTLTVDDHALTVKLGRKREVQAASQSRLSAFGTSAQGQKPGARRPGPARSGFQSRNSAFGKGNSGPTRPRRRGGSQRH